MSASRQSVMVLGSDSASSGDEVEDCAGGECLAELALEAISIGKPAVPMSLQPKDVVLTPLDRGGLHCRKKMELLPNVRLT